MYMSMGKEYNAEETKKMSAADKKAYKDYEGKERAEHDVKILAEAGEIRKDSKRLKMAVRCAMEKSENLKSIVSG